MNKSILNSAVMAAIAISITACSSGGSDVAGIGGSGITSSGTITGFGSIFVNDVEYETPQDATIDDNLSSSDQLAIGMRVTVKGTINADGVTGTATSVTYDDDLDGPVSNLAAVGNDGLFQTMTVLGRQVRISTATNFDVSGLLPPTTQFDFDTIANNNQVEVSGFLDSNSVLIATRVELKAITFDTATIVEIKGTITGLSGSGTSFDLVGVSGVNFNTTGSTTIEDLPNNELANTAFVEVKGTCNNNCTTVTATRIEGESIGFDDNDDVEVEGVITRYNNDGDFDVNGFPVDASGANVERIPSTLQLGVDKEVEVEGNVQNGVLIASKIKDEGEDVKIAARVATGTVNSSAGTFNLEPLPGQTVTVKIDNTSTEIEDESGTITNPTTLFANLADGDYVIVEGYDDGSGTIVASKFDREFPALDEADIILQGVITSTTGDATSGTVTILGVTFPVDGTTDFEDLTDTDYLDPNDFFTDIRENISIVKIKDKAPGSGGSNGVGLADEVDLEQI